MVYARTDFSLISRGIVNRSAQATGAADGTKALILRGAARFMQPIVRLLLKAGVTHPEFAEMCKSVFVGVAGSDYGIRGRKANNSRIAILTGLGRKQVRQQLDLLEKEQLANPSQMSPATRVMSAWHEDPAYLDAHGRPLVLPVQGDAPSFTTLARTYAGDLPVNALLKELRRVNAVVDDGEDLLKIVSRSFLTVDVDPEYVRILSTQLQDLGATIYHNVSPPKGAVRRMQRFVVNENMPPAKVREFQELATTAAQELLEKFDGWLTQHEVPMEERSDSKMKRTGVGVYFFED